MNKKYIIALMVPVISLFVGCEDKLDTQPEGSIITSDQKEEVVSKDPDKAVAGVNAIFAQFSQYMPNEDAIGAERHNDFGYPSVMLFTDANGYDVVSEDNGYNWTGNSLDYSDRDYTSYESQIIWNDMYSMIYAANNVIANIPADVEDPTSQFYLAQGLATRAFNYWVLAQLYQFKYVGHQQEPCVPIITDENAEVAAQNGTPRSSVEEVYSLISSDISAALELLESAKQSGITRTVITEKAEDKRFFSLYVAYGLRARINLSMEKWTEAAADATKAIENAMADGVSPAGISDVSKPSFWTMDEPNWMWGIKIAETDDVVTSGIVNWLSHMGSLNYGYAWYSKGKQINKALYETIEEDDVRKGWWLDEYQESPNLNNAYEGIIADYDFAPFTQVKFAPYNEEAGSSTNASDIPLMRIEEMYLIKAEAQAKGGAPDAGKTTLEEFVKAYRNPAYVCEATSPDGIQEEVFRQRRIELWGEGLNWFDVMRLETGVDRRGGGFPNATMVFNIAPDDPILLWRIPESEIQANPGLSEGDNNPSVPAPEPVADL
ncbi:SusD-like starch-binding protein associating with outer membrane [Marinilabilia salmonicolor]|uniref:RagB/SusD family nutrient uptake outer membrane protein n=1 Tax=Marinilabilia salmonicolor TaxID=989 RepID=UPI000D05C627|nr:RagB/SusD family nutrient uptake outer membrane protein [Marinilabilia salmonicolor]PRZ00317.1 SusD-like starch-binding protein associating with outer membrane [Marinilabilia salmonicolor]